MKELSLEEKAKAYDEALERAKDYHKQLLDEDNPECAGEIENIFPELQESEDERIRKALIDYFNNANKSDENPLHEYGIWTDKVINWLEKQGEQKKENSCSGCINRKGCINCEVGNMKETLEQKPADKVEPKFQNGQWIVWQNKCYKVNDNGCGYELIDQNGLSTSLEYETVKESAHLWTIQDAKDGDILDANGAPFIYKKDDKDYVYFYCGVNLAGEFIEANGIDTWNNNYKVYPAAKEQRDILFQKMKEAHYEWDNEKKELKRIEQVDGFDAELNALLKKYEHLPKEQLLECMNFYVDELEKQWRDEI